VDKAPRPAIWTAAHAPSPETVSAEARRILQDLPNDAAPEDLHAHREMCARVQADLGATWLERHRVTMQDSFIAGVPVRIFMPMEMPPQGQCSNCILLNLHGGGFTVDAGSVTENAALAGYAGLRVVAVRYRLAPEHSFPAAVDDAEAVYRALLTEHAADRIGLYGTSAGACLCAQLLVRIRETGGAFPRAFGFFTGTADLSRSGDSEFFFRPSGDPTLVEEQFSTYLKDSDRRSPQVSPIFSDLTGFPPTLCIAGTRDFMLSQTAIFHRALLGAGVDARLLVFEAMPHAHWIYLDLPESDQAFRAMAGFFRSHLTP
jgi:monoterpene epsilon-lactone hydrolase